MFLCSQIQERLFQYLLCAVSAQGHRAEDEAGVQPVGYELGFWIQTVWEEAQPRETATRLQPSEDEGNQRRVTVRGMQLSVSGRD